MKIPFFLLLRDWQNVPFWKKVLLLGIRKKLMEDTATSALDKEEFGLKEVTLLFSWRQKKKPNKVFCFWIIAINNCLKIL